MPFQKLPSSAFLHAQWQRLMMHTPQPGSAGKQIAVALVLTVLATVLRTQLAPADTGGRFITFSLAAALSALYGGFRAGMVSTLVGLVLVNFFLVRPYFSMAIADPAEAFWLNLWHFLTQLVVVGVISAMQQRNRQLQLQTEQLQASNRQFDETFEHTASGIAHSRLDGSWIRINKTYCNLVGYTREELQNRTFQAITHPDDLDLDLALYRSTLAGERTHFDLDKRYIHKNGHTVWVHLNLTLIRKADGSPNYLIAVVQDIGERKAAEEALRTNERLLRQAQILSGFASWEADLETHRFTTLGDSHERLGLPSSAFSGEQLLALTHPDDQERMWNEWVQALQGLRHYNSVYRSTFGGKERWFSVRAEFERDANGQALRAFGVTQEITDRKQAEHKVQELNALLEERIQERTHALRAAYVELESYSYTVAHDLRSPLRLINGFAQALQEDLPELDAANAKHLDRIRDASKKMGLLIDGLLKLAQFARGEVVRTPVNLSTSATRLLEELAQENPERQVRWEVQPNLHAMADLPLVDALLQNLLHNAWKYTQGTADAHIRVYAETVEGQTRYFVSDNGAGFDMSRAAKLFQPFQRLHMPHEFGGLGIGLATARRIVLRHGGDLYAEASPGQGARFSFSLMADPARPATAI